jgi:drug/metabolite transporter (DMT)-like permease
MALGEVLAGLLKAAPLMGVFYVAGSSSDGAFDWFIDGHHAMAILAGLLGGMGFRLAVVVHKEESKSLSREIIVAAFALPSNFLLGAGITSTLISREPPPYLLIALIGVFVAASGTTMLTLAMKQFIKRFGDGK